MAKITGPDRPLAGQKSLSKPYRKPLVWGFIGALSLAAVLLWGPLATSTWNLWQFSNEFKPAPLPTVVSVPAAAPDAGLGLDFARLGNFGLSTGLFSFRLNRVSDPAEVYKEANFKVRLPSYRPAGFGPVENLNLLKRAGFKFTLDLSKARPYLKELGIEVGLPDDLNGQTIVVTVGDMVFGVFQQTGMAGLNPARSRYLFACGVSPDLQLPPGITLEEFRQGAARIPLNRIPPLLYSQWSIIDPAGTNPLALPPGMRVREVTVDGVKGQIYRTGPQDDTALAWQKQGVFYFLNGGLTDQELVEIANSLR